jgi:hypothetical protein
MPFLRYLLAGSVATLLAAAPPSDYERRVQAVRRTPGFVALWDFVKLAEGRFAAHQAPGDRHDFRLDAVNYVRDYWNQGRPATYADFPLLGRGPFGQAVRIRQEQDPDFRPLLMVPRARLHDSTLDVKGPKRSVSMVVWLIRESGNHAIAGIWHEGTDLHSAASPVARVERGRRQYCLFAGLAGNNGAAAAHVSENGASSFSDRYARNLAVTPQVIAAVSGDAPPDALDRAWSVAGFTFDNARNTVTAYLNGEAQEYWIDQPEKHPFYQWPAKGWAAAQTKAPAFPKDQYYRPPEGKPLSKQVLEDRGDRRVELHVFAFTKVRVTLQREPGGKFSIAKRELAALKANPFWFGHDLFTPPGVNDGGPFTIGRVIHTSRSVGFTGYIGGVAVFGAPLSAREMRKLATVARQPIGAR